MFDSRTREEYRSIHPSPALEERVRALEMPAPPRSSHPRRMRMATLAAALLLVCSILLARSVALPVSAPLYAQGTPVRDEPVSLVQGYSRGLAPAGTLVSLPLHVEGPGPMTLSVTEGFLSPARLPEPPLPQEDTLTLPEGGAFYWILPEVLQAPKLSIETPAARHLYGLILFDGHVPLSIQLEETQRK